MKPRRQFMAGVAFVFALTSCSDGGQASSSDTTTTTLNVYADCEQSIAQWADYLSQSMNAGGSAYGTAMRDLRFEVGSESPLYRLIPAIARDAQRAQLREGRNADVSEQVSQIHQICTTYVDQKRSYPMPPPGT